jgi:putative transferase (TIGR04331 family)
VKKEARFLITTALEETWVENQPVLFLGEWCRLYPRKSRWSGMDAALLPYHWDDRDKLYSDYNYLNTLYRRVLSELASKLNRIHNVEHSLRYWRILVGPWLAYFIHALLDRWLSIESAINIYEISGTIVLTGNEEHLVPNDMYDFVELVVSDEWNHKIYAEILLQFDTASVIVKNIGQRCRTPNSWKAKASSRNKALRIYSGIAKRLVQDRDAFLMGTYLTKLDEARLQLRLGQIPPFWQSIEPDQITLDNQQRNWKLPGHGNSDFENFLLAMLPKQIPLVYLEGYHPLVEQIYKLPWPKSPKLIYTSNVLWHDTISMAYAAEKAEQGTPIVYGQHGGGYRTARFHFAEEHEIEIADRYLTWGWTDIVSRKISPVGVTKIGDRSRTPGTSKDVLLLVTMNSFRYSYRLCAESAINYQNYINRVFSFVVTISDVVIHKLLVRLSLAETGVYQSMQWRDRFPNIELELGGANIYELLQEARIVVQTYNQTGFLESLALGIPTVLFCDLKVTPLRQTAIPYYDELRRVGIFHDGPESAASHVNAIWDDVDAWWTSTEVQDVVAHFTRQYCHRPDNILNRVETALREAIADTANKGVMVD